MSTAADNRVPAAGAEAGILVVRPSRDPDEFVVSVAALGYRVWALPVLCIESLDQSGTADAVIDGLQAYRKLIFVSANAARLGGAAIARRWSKLPPDLEYFAVGAATATALEQALLQARGKSVQLPERADSEGLLALPALQSVRGERIAIFRGVGGRETLGETLRLRGARVDYVELYRRSPEWRHRDQIRQLIATHCLAMVVVHSGELLQQLLAVAGDEQRAALQQAPLLVPGSRVAALAQTAGFLNIVVSASAVTSDMVDALRHWYTEPPKLRR